MGAWLAPRLGPFGGWVGSVVPRGFPAYARLLHPVAGRDGKPTTWAEVCTTTGRRAHALMQWQSIISPPRAEVSGREASSGEAWDGNEPRTGELVPEALSVLCRILAEHTDPAQACLFALWDGHGWIYGGPSVAPLEAKATNRALEPGEDTAPAALPPAFSGEVMAGPRLHHPGRDYLVFTGPLDAAKDMGWWLGHNWFEPQSPNLFWPAARSWCVATEIDFDSTLLGGDTDLIDAVLAAADLETWPVGPDDSLRFDGDTINT